MTASSPSLRGHRRGAAGAMAVLCLLSAPAGALTPLPPCSSVSEANMWIGIPDILGDWEAQSGVVVESYYNKTAPKDTVYTPLPAPVKALENFSGMRVTHCASGKIMAVRDISGEQAVTALAATEFLRDKLKAHQKISYGDVKKAVVALYGKPIELMETAQTCGCANYFDGMRPASQIPFDKRTDVGN